MRGALSAGIGRFRLNMILVALMINGPLSDAVEQVDCDSVFQTMIWGANDSDISRLKVELHHPFLTPETGVVPNTTYTVGIEIPAILGKTQLYLTTLPVGNFSSASNTTVPCDDSGTSLLTNVTRRNAFFTWRSPFEQVANDSVDFMAVYTERSGNMVVATASLPWTKGCVRAVTASYGNLNSEDLQGLLMQCTQVSVLVKSLPNTRIVLQFQEFQLPDRKHCYVAVDTNSSGTGGQITSRTQDVTLKRFISVGPYLMVRISECQRDCHFRAILHTVYSLLDCNATYNSSEGVITSPGYPEYYVPDLDCHYSITSSSDSKLLLVVHELYLQDPVNCDSDYIQISPIQRIRILTLCQSVSNTAYLSSTNSLNIRYHAATVLGRYHLSYREIHPCQNSTYSNLTGDICTREYYINHICQYSFRVPLGYAVEMHFTKVEISSDRRTNQCVQNYIEIISANRVIATLCGNWTGGGEYPRFQSVGNTMEVKIFVGDAAYGEGVMNEFCFQYHAVAVNKSLTSCEYGWVSRDKYCYYLSKKALPWGEANLSCILEGGHLVSITSPSIGNLIDQVIKSSDIYGKVHSFWIGANDIDYENYYKWADGQPFVYANWFPGWSNQQNYKAQPSDDGLTAQDCVELRDVFPYRNKGSGITDKFYWNDRDCEVANYFVCQRTKPGVVITPISLPDCNRTINLNRMHNRDVIFSPGYSHAYPASVECYYQISSPQGYSVDLQFTDLQLENNEDCQYDYVQLEDGPNYKRRYCGDWRKRIKLLRHVSSGNVIHLKFSTDVSHNYAGFRAEVFLYDRTPTNTLCESKKFHSFSGHCYLIAPFPEVSWPTAYKICAESQTYLVTIHNPEEEEFLYSLIRTTEDYMSGSIYWLGAKRERALNPWQWIDGKPVIFTSDGAISRGDVTYGETSVCLAIQWRRKNELSGLYWIQKDCSNSGRYICKKSAIVLPENLNETLTASSGILKSFNSPSHYVNNLHYVTTIQSPPPSRIVFRFEHIDLEWQEECLYDYVALKSSLNGPEMKVCGQEDDRLDRFDYLSDKNILYVIFHSDYSLTSSGFVATWKAVDISSCMDRYLNVTEPGYLTSVGSPGPYLPGLDCLTVLRVVPEQKLLISVVYLDVGQGDNCSRDYLRINLGEDAYLTLCGNNSHYPSGYTLLSYGAMVKVFFHSDANSRYVHTGYNITYKPWNDTLVQSVLRLDAAKGVITSVNYPLLPPQGINITQRLVAPIGSNIQLKFPNDSRRLIGDCNRGEVRLEDVYGENTTSLSCPSDSESVEIFTSTLNSVFLHSPVTNDGFSSSYRLLFASVKDPQFVSKSLFFPPFVDSCNPNPCQHGGECIRNKDQRAFLCRCEGQFTGLFCHVQWCDLQPCGEHGHCNLTEDSYTCDCQPKYTGEHCTELVAPCNPNPCKHGRCILENNGTFVCKCHVWYEGVLCETYALKVPYKPLSQRMLEEPFWLGLITVSVVLLVILCVYCIKRKFADKIEKFLSEEIERSKNHPSPPTTRYSLSSNQPCMTPANLSPQTCPKSILNRIRKHSIRSTRGGSTSPTDREMGCTFSFDEILKRAAQTSSHPKKATSTTSTSTPSNGSEKKDEETSRILASLVTSSSPRQRRMSLDEFLRISERKIQMSTRKVVSQDETSPTDTKTAETSFIGCLSPRVSRFSAPSFTDFHSVKEQSFEQNSSSDSLSGEPKTSEVQAEVSPQASDMCAGEDQKAQETLSSSPPNPPEIFIIVDEASPTHASDGDSCANHKCSGEGNSDESDSNSPPSNKTVFLDVPTADCPNVTSNSSSVQNSTLKSPNLGSPILRKPEIVRKYSVDLPTPKILITANMNSCDSDETSPPRSPNPIKPMAYLSPLTVICSSADRTISESNLSTSGYSSLSSPGLSRCNSSSPLSDELEVQQSLGNKTRENTSPHKAGSHLLSPSYLTVKSDRTFQFPPTHVYPCLEIFQQPGCAKRRGSLSGSWYPAKDCPSSQTKPTRFRSPYHQPISRQNSIEDEGIGMESCDPIDSEIRTNKDVENFSSQGSEKDVPKQDSLIAEKPTLEKEVEVSKTFPRIAPVTTVSSESDEADSQVDCRSKGRRARKSPSPKQQSSFTNISLQSERESGDTDGSEPQTSEESNSNTLLLKKVATPTEAKDGKEAIKNIKQNSCPIGPSASRRWIQLPAQRTYPVTHRKAERLQSVESADSSVPSDAEDVGLYGAGTMDQHPALKRQSALSEEDGDSEDSSGDTTVLLRKNHNVSLLKNTSKKSDDSASSPRITVSLSDSSSIPSLPELFDSGSLSEHLVTEPEEEMSKKHH